MHVLNDYDGLALCYRILDKRIRKLILDYVSDEEGQLGKLRNKRECEVRNKFAKLLNTKRWQPKARYGSGIGKTTGFVMAREMAEKL